MIVWLNNFKEGLIEFFIPTYEAVYAIRCPFCKKVQKKANWHYQRCRYCDEYMYDLRW